MIDDLKGLSGGKKQMWNRDHRDLIMRYCEIFGPDDTCEKFNLERETLSRLYTRSNRELPLSKADKAYIMAQVSREAANDLRREVQQLKKDYAEFQSTVAGQVANKILIPWIQAAIQLSEDLEVKGTGDGPAELSLNDLQVKRDFRLK